MNTAAKMTAAAAKHKTTDGPGLRETYVSGRCLALIALDMLQAAPGEKIAADNIIRLMAAAKVIELPEDGNVKGFTAKLGLSMAGFARNTTYIERERVGNRTHYRWTGK